VISRFRISISTTLRLQLLYLSKSIILQSGWEFQGTAPLPDFKLLKRLTAKNSLTAVRSYIE
jgi:hypothetical protein